MWLQPTNAAMPKSTAKACMASSPFDLRVVMVLAAGAGAAGAEPNTRDGPAAPPAPAAPRPPPAGGNPSPPPAAPVVAATPAMTVERARGECWMKLEADKKASRDL